MTLNINLDVNRHTKEDFPIKVKSENLHTKAKRTLVYIHKNGNYNCAFTFLKNGIFRITAHTNTNILLLEKTVEI